MVWNTEEGCVELWLGTASKSIFTCLKPRCLGNGRTAGAFRGYGAGDEGSRSREAKLRGDFPSRGLFISGREKVSDLPPLLEPGGKEANCSPQEQGPGNKLDPT
ncbi:30S ribosomal protein S14 [Dissostichus eleginoides]|uniref:30S ribosomal protein S14 n=1 Tax=Dissostichus eleginoides TaxID=100907 RepID=A0AAD9CQ45_DISEL|nr:30S ribosomal protein S14 [Dissostichus eleginoides]